MNENYKTKLTYKVLLITTQALMIMTFFLKTITLSVGGWGKDVLEGFGVNSKNIIKVSELDIFRGVYLGISKTEPERGIIFLLLIPIVVALSLIIKKCYEKLSEKVVSIVAIVLNVIYLFIMNTYISNSHSTDLIKVTKTFPYYLSIFAALVAIVGFALVLAHAISFDDNIEELMNIGKKKVDASSSASSVSDVASDATSVSDATAEKKETPNFCTNCGNKLNPGDVFCTNCGAKVE
ncbi:MAG: zinc ribbon domain-containing protein [Lachnospiraceae bacterium]|nr:zinc ribbon domain-containing protein [Lachnospiraceae bacterium]